LVTYKIQFFYQYVKELS